MTTRASVVCSLLALQDNAVVIAERTSLLMGVSAFPPDIKRPDLFDKHEQVIASSTPLLFPEIVTQDMNISMDSYRQVIHHKFTKLQEALGVTFNYYMNSCHPNIDNVGVTYHYILYYVPTKMAQNVSVQVKPEYDTRVSWSELDASGLQRLLDTAMASLTSVFTSKPYVVESIGKLLHILDPTEYEVLLSAISGFNLDQYDRQSWYVPILDIENAIGAQSYQLEQFKLDDARRRTQQHDATEKSATDHATLNEQMSAMHTRYQSLGMRNAATITDAEIAEHTIPKGEDKFDKDIQKKRQVKLDVIKGNGAEVKQPPVKMSLVTPSDPAAAMSKRADMLAKNEALMVEADVSTTASASDSSSGKKNLRSRRVRRTKTNK